LAKSFSWDKVAEEEERFFELTSRLSVIVWN
jgi:hypothetical protein